LVRGLTKQEKFEANFEELFRHIGRVATEHNELKKSADERDYKRRARSVDGQLANHGQAGSSDVPMGDDSATRPRPAPRHPRRTIPEHLPLNPVTDRTLRLTGFGRRHLTPDELKAFVEPLLSNAPYERLTSAYPRSAEARIIFKSQSDRDTFKAAATAGAHPIYTDPATHEATRLYWVLPESKSDRHKFYIVRKLKVALATAHKDFDVETKQRSGRIYVNKLPLLTVYVDPDTDEPKPRFDKTTMDELGVQKAAIEDMPRKAVAE
jgi:hypothetical protein